MVARGRIDRRLESRAADHFATARRHSERQVMRHVEAAETASISLADSLTISDLVVSPYTVNEVASEKPPTNCTTVNGAQICEILPVQITVTLSDVYGIDETNAQYSAQGQVVLEWTDMRLALPSGTSRVQLDLDDAWYPEVDYYNSIDTTLAAQKLALQLNESGYAKMTHTTRFDVSLACRMNYAYYPGDKHALPFEVEIFSNPSDVVAFTEGAVNLLDGAEGMAVWNIANISSVISSETKPATSLSYSRFTAHLDTERILSAYIFNLYLPYYALLFVVFSTFFIDPRAVPARAALTIISLLTAISFYNHAAENLPPAGYFIFSDFFGIAVIFSACLALFSFIYVHWLLRKWTPIPQAGGPKNGALLPEAERLQATEGNDAAAERIDSLARRYFLWIALAITVGLSLPPIIRSFIQTYDEGDIK